MQMSIVTAVAGAGRHTITVGGAIDLQSRAELVDAVHTALAAAGCSAVVLNLAAVTFIDSTGIGAIVEIARDAAETGVTFTLQEPSAIVLRILQVTGLQEVWTIEPVATA